MRRVLLALLLLFPTFAFAERSLYWDSVAVRAKLDEAGTLHIREEQTYVFDGDWNGGERIFRVEKDQEFRFVGISRVAPDGTLVPLQHGSLDAVDGYAFTDATTLRWRSRLPGDPPFANTRITYVLEYSLSKVLLQRAGRFLLNHDFAFPDRSGEIRKFTLDLVLDPAWSAPGVPGHLELGPLPPGREAIVKGTLDYRGDPGALAVREDTLPLRAGIIAVMLLIPLLLGVALVRRERALGRFEPLETSFVTPAWIEQHLLPIPAEVAGAAWDESVGQSEVAALIARWSAEEKVTTTAQSGDEMVMRLNVPRDRFREEYERELIDKLFFAGDETSTTAIRAHYKEKGFSPESVITGGVAAKADELTKKSDPAPPVRKIWTFLLFIAVAVLCKMAFERAEEGGVEFLAAAGLFFSGVCWMVAFLIALNWRGRIDYGRRQMRPFIIPLVMIAGVAVAIILSGKYSTPMYLAYATAVIMTANSTFNAAKSKRGRTAIAFRKRLASVREYFIHELREKSPTLDDRWFPYIVAFGLNDEANAWMREFGVAAASTSSSMTSTSFSSSSSSSSGSPRWTGGGGAFGGAGATGSWAAAASGLAAGVAAPSSSSSGGGSSSSSSGGGGGGGW